MTTMVRLNKSGVVYPPVVFIREKLTAGLKRTSFQVSSNALTKPNSFRRSQAGPSSAPSTSPTCPESKGVGHRGIRERERSEGVKQVPWARHLQSREFRQRFPGLHPFLPREIRRDKLPLIQAPLDLC